MSHASHVSLAAIDTINTLPQRYYPAMLEFVLRLRRLPQARFDTLVERVSLRALDRSLSENDVRELGHLLSDRHATADVLDWFMSDTHADVVDVKKHVDARAGNTAYRA